ncbi:MAG: 16S rRNA pseudouridine516 synthase [Bradymonadia bacterium]|jgi:16S rRNA pseudouridine516 synthase
MQKVLAQTGLVSRRRLRRQARFVQSGDLEIPISDIIEIGAQWREFSFNEFPFWVCAAPPVVVAYHKRVDEVTSTRPDGGAIPIFDVVAEQIDAELGAVGRLDRDTTGLLLLTEDGQLQHRLTHPRYNVPRVYVATPVMPVDDETLTRLASEPMALRDGHVPAPSNVSRDGDSVRLTLHEGKYHEVRRLFAAFGAPLTGLRRVSYGTIVLGEQPAGLARELEDEERAALYASVGASVPEPSLRVSLIPPSGFNSGASSAG